MLHLERLSRPITKSDLLISLHAVGGLEPRRVGRIELRAGEALIEVPDDGQARLVKALDDQTLGARRHKTAIVRTGVLEVRVRIQEVPDCDRVIRRRRWSRRITAVGWRRCVIRTLQAGRSTATPLASACLGVCRRLE